MNLKIKAFFITLLMGSLLYAETPIVEIVTSLTKSGGIYGDGKFNSIGDMVNGREICSQNNTNANIEPGCDMFQDTGYDNNGTQDPTDDSYSGDLIVRSSDIFELNVGWSIFNTTEPATLTSTLPSSYFSWEPLPSSCKDGSSISDDGLTMTCVRSGYNSSGSYAQDLPFNIKVKGNTPNGTKTGLISVTVSADGATSKTDDPDGELTVTAAPKWNIQKKLITYYSETVNGVDGYNITYGFFLEADEVYGETDTASAVLGNEALGSDFTLNFTDVLTDINDTAIPNAELIGCRIDTISGEPYPFYNSTYPERSLGSLEADLTLNCSQSGGKGTEITVDYTGIDASLNHVATRTTSNAIIPLTRLPVASGIIEIFIPLEDVKNAVSLGNDIFELKTKNKITSFDPDSISNQSNFGTNSESTKDNIALANIRYYGPGYTGGSFYKYFTRSGTTTSCLETTTNGCYSADGMVTPNREFGARIEFSNSGNKDFNNSILCDVIDANTYDLVDYADNEGVAVIPNANSAEMNYTIEYGTGYVAGSWPPALNQNNSASVINECKDASVTWYGTTTEAKAVAPITKVRVSIPSGIPSKKTASFLLNLEARGEDLSGNILPNNTNLVNYMAVHDDVLYESQTDNWIGASRVLNEYPTPASGGSYKADRAVLTRAIVRTVKSLSLSVTEPGDEVDVTIKSTFTTDNTLGEQDVVVVKEMLDVGLKYVVGSANIGDPVFGTCDDLEDTDSLKNSCTAENQILIWNLGTREANKAIEDITYTFILSATTPKGTSHTYTIISSPADTSNVDIRKSNKNITVNIPAELIITKEVNTPFREIDQSPIEFTTFVRNGSAKDLTELDIIDIIPFNGDGEDGFKFSSGSIVIDKKRVEPTSFNGTLEFIEASGDYSCASGVTWFYSNKIAKDMDLSPVATTNKSGGTTTWCQGTQTGPDSGCGFINKDVTAIRLTGPSLAPDASCSFKVFLKPTSNKYGDIYTNTAGAFANGVSLPVMSNDVSAIVPTIALGDYVWIDSNGNGVQDVSEKGVEGIGLELLDENDDVLKTTTSDNYGKYLFSELTEDVNYKVRAVVPSYYTFSPKAQGGDDTKDSDVDENGITDIKSLNINQKYSHLDIGLTSSLNVSGRVYTVGDDTGIENTEVKLYKDVNSNGKIDENDTLVETITIPVDGTYEFTNVFNGNYVVGVFDPNTAIPTGYELITAKEVLPALVNGANVIDKDFPYSVGPDSDDKLNPSILTTKGPTDILDLSGSDADGKVVAFIIKSLPDSDEGILYLADGGTEVKVGDKLTIEKANGLKFDPKYGFIGNTTFTYSAVDDTDLVDSTPATVTIPVHGLSNLGDTVWYDDNKDGKQDSTERGVNGVEVTLYDAIDNVIKVVVTDENGKYIFRDLKDGTYKVGFSDLPSGYKISPKDIGADDKDSDVDPATGISDSVTLAVSSNDLTVDMGIYSDELSVIGDSVWYDDNKNGIQDTDELGVNGVKVTLYNGTNVEATTVTDLGGSYIFRGLKNGTYTIGFSSLPSGYKITKKDEGADDSIDSDADLTTGKTGDIVVTTASVNLDADMGIYSDDPSIATLGDTVWYDDNKNGIQDSEELGVNGVKVSLYDSANAVVKTTVTDSRGTYLFRNLLVGTYTVGFSSLPSGYKITQQSATSDDKDSDVDPATTKTANITVTKGSDNLDVDMGIYSDGFLVSTIGDTVWYDDDKDGIQDETELGASGVKVTLYKGSTVIKSTVTDSRGTYLFRDVISGDYTIGFTNLPLGYKISPKTQGADTSKDSDVVVATGKTETISVGAGSNNLDVDMGIYSDSDLISTIGDSVWYDDNKDGVQDATEKGVSGVKVTLFDDGTKAIKTTVTDEQGSYIFRDVLDGTYTLGFSNLPNGYKISPRDTTSDGQDSDVKADGTTGTITVTVGSNNLDVDMGIYSDKLSMIGDSVWFDSNKDGIQDVTEHGVEGVRVSLYDSSDKVVQTTVTDAEGNYIFRAIEKGTYYVEFKNLPASYKISPKDKSSDDKDSDVNGDGTTDNITTTVGSVNLDVDLGIYSDELSTIGNSVWYDDNKNGIQDATEKGVQGVKVALYNSIDEIIGTTVTDKEGTYLFRDVKNGTYYVAFSDLPNNYKISPKDKSSDEKDSDADQTSGKSDNFTLTVGTKNLDIDMGIYSDKLSTIGDTVWYDDNKDGVQDPTEQGVDGVKVTLYDSNDNVVKTTVTDKKGVYLFRDVLNGTYTIGFSSLPSNYKISPKDVGQDDKDSDVDTNGKTEEITVSVGTNNLTVDMGIYSDKLSSIGDSVWYDDNKDGVQDADEFGAEGIKVTLYSGTKVVDTAVTDRDGAYVFRDVIDGTYTVGFSNLPNGYKISPKDATSDEKDSDVDVTTGKTDDIVITVGSTKLDIDMGIYSDKLSSIGDAVWYDDNKDGIQDETEFGAEGVHVTLYNSSDKVVQTAVTDRRGTYLFRDIVEGTYVVGFSDLPNGYKLSPKDAGSDTEDSDVDPSTLKSDEIKVTKSSTNLTIDMGIYSDKLSIIGDAVWYDDNKDGIQDETEFGAEGIEVTLYAGSKVIQTAVTDRRGTYVFRDIIEGTYRVGFSNLPNGYKISPKDAGADDKDSDVNANGKTGNIVVTRSSHNLGVDMGIYSDKLSIIGDSVWYDDNRDGIQDEHEFGAEGIKVVLYSGSKIVQTVVTDRRGTYIFRDIVEGTYQVGFSNLPSGYRVSPKDATTDDKDSDINVASGKTDNIVVTRSSHTLNIDMGIYSNKLSLLGDSVWYDDNKNGLQDETEFGAEGIKVTLYSGTKIVNTVVTDRKGTYVFRDVLNGTYTLGFSDLPSGYRISPKNAGDKTKDSDVNVKTAKSDTVVVTVGTVNLDIDMGIYSNKLSNIGDSVWYDNNRNGIQEDFETGVDGVRVTLYNSNGNVVQTTVTDERGVYTFRAVLNGTYVVGFSDLPTGFKISPKNVGDDAFDSDVDVNTGKSDSFIVSVGSNNLTIDMGIYSDTLATIGNSVWYDDNRNGVQDSFEKGVDAVKVTLYTKAGVVVDVTTTDSLGAYHFYRVVPNSYYLIFSNLPVGYKITAKDIGNNEKDSDANILTGQTVVTKLEAGENDLSWDMGIYNEKRATLGDTVWYDDNKNGLQDAYERGVGSVKVTLYTDDDLEIDSTVTDNKGNYKFSSLVPANYYMIFSDLPISYEATVKDAGADSQDSDVDPKTLRTDTTTLIAGENDLSWDMGIYDNKGASIGDTVWYDDNANGIQDAYELGAEDVLVRLFTEGGTKVDTVITDDKGGYSFRNLVPGAYYVEFAHLPVGYEVSPQDAGDDAKDSDVDALTLRTAVITVGIGENMMDVDLGIFNKQKGTIGDLVWFDTNHNGLQDRDEKGVNGIKVTLFNAKEEVVATRVTSKTGQYLFRDLVAGDYFLEFSEFPLGYMITKKNVKDDFLSDSDANYHKGQTALTTLDAGENDLSWDLGIYTPQLASIGDKVWLDDNRDGIQNSNEKGIAGVKITLVKNDIPQTPEEQTTTSTKSVVTDENGNYIFKNIEVGEPHRYHLIFDDSSIFDDYQFSIANQGGNDNLDSDVDPKTKKTPDFILTGDIMNIDVGVEGFAVNDDSVEADAESSVTTIALLNNDSGNIDTDTILFVDAKEGKILYNNGTAVGGASLSTTQTYIVKGEGVWQVESDGTVTFTAEKGFRGVPSPVYYIVQGVSGKQSNIAKITISTPCAAYRTSNSVSTLSYGSMLLIFLAISILGLLFARREFEAKV